MVQDISSTYCSRTARKKKKEKTKALKICVVKLPKQRKTKPIRRCKILHNAMVWGGKKKST